MAVNHGFVMAVSYMVLVAQADICSICKVCCEDGKVVKTTTAHPSVTKAVHHESHASATPPPTAERTPAPTEPLTPEPTLPPITLPPLSTPTQPPTLPPAAFPEEDPHDEHGSKVPERQGQRGEKYYAAYMDKYAGKWGQNSYANKYTGGNSQPQNGDYQQYMKKYGGQSSEGSSGGYQRYVQEYAANYSDKNASYMHGGNSDGSSQGGGYGKYMKKYGDSYSKYMPSHASQTSEGNSGGYQKYMREYAANYSDKFARYMHGGKPDGSSQGGSYQEYVQKYGDSYGKYMPAHSSQTSQDSSGDYQRYMKEYAANYSDKYTSYMHGGTSDGSSQGGGYEGYMKMYGDNYSKFMPRHSSQTSEGSRGDYQRYMKEYAANYSDKYSRYMHGGKSDESRQMGGYEGYMNKFGGSYSRYMPGHATSTEVASYVAGGYGDNASSMASALHSQNTKETSSMAPFADNLTSLVQQPSITNLTAMNSSWLSGTKWGGRVEQYAGKYEPYMQHGSDHNENEHADYHNYIKHYEGEYSNYTQYVTKYAAGYGKHTGEDGNQSGTGDYQQYMRQYGINQTYNGAVDYQRYVNTYASNYSHYMEKGANHSETGDYQKYIRQFVGNHTQLIQNVSAGLPHVSTNSADKMAQVSSQETLAERAPSKLLSLACAFLGFGSLAALSLTIACTRSSMARDEPVASYITLDP